MYAMRLGYTCQQNFFSIYPYIVNGNVASCEDCAQQGKFVIVVFKQSCEIIIMYTRFLAHIKVAGVAAMHALAFSFCVALEYDTK